MNRTNIAASVVDGHAGGKTADAAGRIPSSRGLTEAPCCFHCGEQCTSGAVVEDARNFCCLGCQTVYALLTESGLGQFYDFASTPGARVGRTTEPRQWAFLDDPAVLEKLFDFADEHRATVTLRLPTIHCVACVWLLENLFRLRPGIGASVVNFGRREVSISFERDRVKLSDIAALLASLGYEPMLTLDELDKGASGKTQPWRRRQWLQLGIAGFGFGNAMLLALPGYMGLDSSSGPWFKPLAGWLGLGLALPVLLYSAADFWRAAWFSVRQRTLTLDVPIALGLAVIYGQSVFEVASGRGEGYCDSLTGLVFFLLCGRVFQRMTFDRLAFDRDYKGFFPLAVVRMKEAGEEPVSISQLVVGDRLLIRHGELLPADARLMKGEARVDYSFVTGESEPIKRATGEHLYAGGRQVGGAIEVETLKPVSESYLTSLWNNEAFRKPRADDLDSITNRYSRRFTAGVVGIAVAAAVFWLLVDASIAMKAFTSVLIVACPCALALAAPLTLGTAQRLLAARNVFLRNAQVVESLADVDTVVFDKTGTLTAPGSGRVTWQGTPLTAAEESLIHSMARHSTHPLARQVGEGTHADCLEVVHTFLETPGCGMEGGVAGRNIWMGSAAWLEARGVIGMRLEAPRDAAFMDTTTPVAAAEDAKSPPPLRSFGTAQNAGVVHVAVDGHHRGFFVLESALRPELGALIQRLRGTHPLVLLSGDNAREAEFFRALLGGDARLEFNQSPFDKLQVIQELQASGRHVMMVGDGLNDAGALRQAHVGVAVVEKVGTFSPASDVILDAAQLPRLAEVLSFSRRAARVVRAGFAVSGLYNVAGVAIAAAGLLSPLVCAVLMPLSSVTVVLFSIGATRWMAQRTFDDPAVRSREAQASGHVKANLWTPAPIAEAVP